MTDGSDDEEQAAAPTHAIPAKSQQRRKLPIIRNVPPLFTASTPPSFW